MFHIARKLAVATTLVGITLTTTATQAADFIISTGLGKPHLWVGAHMDPFADAIEAGSKGGVKFTRFYAGELTQVGLSSMPSPAARSRSPLRCWRPITRAGFLCRT